MVRKLKILVFIPIIISCIHDGPIETFYPNGNPKVQGSILHGKQAGTWKYYAEDGDLTDEKIFEKGIERVWIHYHINGEMNFINIYDSDGELHGEELCFYKDGQLQYRGFSYHGHKDTMAILFFNHMPIISLGYTYKGNRIATWTYINSLGDTIQIDRYVNDSIMNYQN